MSYWGGRLLHWNFRRRRVDEMQLEVDIDSGSETETGLAISKREKPVVDKTGRYYAGLTAVFTTLLVYGSFLPFEFVSLDFAAALELFDAMFENPWGTPGSSIDWSVNVLTTVPLGFCGLGMFLADGRRSVARTVWVMPLVLVSICGLSFAVEFGQIWFAGRVPSLKDVIAQFSGTLTGAMLWLVFGDRITLWFKEFVSHRGPRGKSELCLQAYVFCLIFYSMLPLDVITTSREFVRKYGNGQFEWIPFSYRYGSAWLAAYRYATQVALFVPVGLCSAVAGRRPDQPIRRGLDSFVLGAIVVLGIELAQAMLVSRYSSTTDLILGSCGVAIGVLIARRFVAASSDRNLSPASERSKRLAAVWILGAVAYAFILAAVFWAPYDFTHDRQLIKQRLAVFWSLPFSRMQAGSDLLAMFSAIRMFTWFAPLGLLLGVGIASLANGPNFRKIGFVLATAAIAALAMGIEAGQVLLPDKFADSTDALICSAGGVFGLWLAAKIFKESK